MDENIRKHPYESLIFAVVDDDAQAREVIVDFLKVGDDNFPLQFSDGKQAYEYICENRVDFVISDWEMPYLNGLGLLKALRGRPESAQMPFIMIASQMSNEAIKIADAKQAGADAYLIKPFRKALLLEKISDVLFERRWARRRAAVVVDDDETVRSFLAQSMGALGFSPVYEGKTGIEGGGLLDQHLNEVDIVVCDWDMPEMTGIELLRRIRANKQASRIPFIMATAQTPEEQKKLSLAIQSEVDHYLLKPFRLKDLQEKVDMVLAKAKARALNDHLLQNATMAIENRDHNAAERLYEQLLTKDPANSRALLGLAEIELSRSLANDTKMVIRYLERAIAANPRWDVPHLRLASVYEVNVMAIEKAIECLKHAVATCHASAEVHYQLGRLLLKRGRPDLGLAELKTAVELNPAHAEAIDLLANPEKGKKKE